MHRDIAAFSVSIVIALLTAASAHAATHERPNIVVILADDLGYGDLGCYNADSKIPTPRLDQLAAEGIRFTDAHSPSAVCTPTRYGLLTGRYCWRSRLKAQVLPPWGATLIEEGRLTLPELLRQNGYRTACIGKWHLGWSWPTKDGRAPESGSDRLSNVDFTRPIADGPTTRGFDYYFGVDVPNYPPYCYIENDRTIDIPSAPSTPVFNRPGPMLPGWKWVDILPELTRRAVRYVEESAASEPRRPFFLYFPLTSPHYPIVPAAEFQGRSRAGAFGDFVAQTDWSVGQVLDALDRADVADDTLVIFTSDNGPEITGEVRIGAYDRLQKFDHASMGALRGAKRDLWEGGHRVPLIVRWPGHTAAGATSDQLASHVDIMASVAEILEAELPADAAEDSWSLLAALEGGRSERAAVVYHGSRGAFAIREGDWVLIDSASGQENDDRNGEPEWFRQARGYAPHDQPRELFNLADDPAQRRNLYAERADIADRLQALLAKYKADGRSRP